MAKNGYTFKINGIDDLNKKLKHIKEDVLKDSLRASVKVGMKVVKDDAISRAQRIDDPKTPNTIYDEIAMRTKWDKHTKTMSAKVGVMGGANYKKGDKQAGRVTYWRFVEYGTERSRARPFLRPALQNNVNRVLNDFVHELRRQFNRRT